MVRRSHLRVRQSMIADTVFAIASTATSPSTRAASSPHAASTADSAIAPRASAATTAWNHVRIALLSQMRPVVDLLPFSLWIPGPRPEPTSARVRHLRVRRGMDGNQLQRLHFGSRMRCPDRPRRRRRLLHGRRNRQAKLPDVRGHQPSDSRSPQGASPRSHLYLREGEQGVRLSM